MNLQLMISEISNEDYIFSEIEDIYDNNIEKVTNADIDIKNEAELNDIIRLKFKLETDFSSPVVFSVIIKDLDFKFNIIKKFTNETEIIDFI